MELYLAFGSVAHIVNQAYVSLHLLPKSVPLTLPSIHLHIDQFVVRFSSPDIFKVISPCVVLVNIRIYHSPQLHPRMLMWL